MHLKLIWPARKTEWGEDFWSLKTLAQLMGKKAAGAPLVLPTLAALTPPDIEVSIVDENVEPIDFDEKVDLVGISFYTSLAPRAYEIADEFRRRNITVILGGIHASMLPGEAIQHADAVVIGEAEDIWGKVIQDFREGKLKSFYYAKYFPDLRVPLIPRWDLLKSHNYYYFTVQTGRGCPYNCEFCSVRLFNGQQYRHKIIENVIREIEILKSIDDRKMIFFADDNLLAVSSYAKSLFEALIPFKIKWWCQASVNKLKNDDLLDLMYEAGCRMIFVGFESVSQKSLESMNKGNINKVEEYKEIVEKVYSHGIGIFGSFILGSDSDDESIFENTVEFITNASIPFSMINILTPSPGTKLYLKLKREGRLLHEEWEKYNGESVCFKPKLMSPCVLYEGRNWVMRQIYSYDALYKRLRKVWNKGVLVRDRYTPVNRFTKGRIYFTLKSLLNRDIERNRFILKSLWDPRGTSVGGILMALNFHDYAYNLS